MRVLIVDDYKTVRDALRVAFEIQGNIEVVGEAGTAHEAIELCKRVEADIVIMDFSLPDMDGLSATQLIREFCPTIKVAILTTSLQPDKASLEAAGVDTWLRKAGAFSEMLQALWSVHTQDSTKP